MATNIRVLLCTCPHSSAESIARGLLERRLAACVNAVPGVVSRYWWREGLEREEEVLLLIKTAAPHVDRVIEALEDLHPYDTPELLSLPVESGAEPYMAWVVAETGEQPEREER